MLAVAALIFLGTLTLVIWQPRELGIGWSAVGGAVLALATTVVHFSDVPVVAGLVWNATITFVAIVLISVVLDRCGFFEWAALHVARWGQGSGRLLFALIVLLGAVVSALFSNDGAALILTPIVLRMLVQLRFPAPAALAFVMATGFIADTGSMPLVVSNLVNIVSADFFGIGFGRYAEVMLPVGLVAVSASLLVLWCYYRRQVPRGYSLEVLRAPESAITDRPTFRAGLAVLVVLLAGYFTADPLGIPLCGVAGAGALVLLAVAGRWPRWLFGGEPGSIRVGAAVRAAPWRIVVFSLGMYLVVYGLRNQGMTAELARLFRFFSGHGVLLAALGTGFVVALLSSVMNNLPTVLIGALAVGAAGASGLGHEAMVYANVLGSDIGPKITPIGSLATLLWLHVLDREGMHIGWGRYCRTGAVLTAPVLAVTLLALAGWLLVLRC